MQKRVWASVIALAAASEYCPSANDMNLEQGNVQFQDGGWAFTGKARVSSKTSWNLLGGYMEFNMDTTRTQPEVNTNFYTSSPAQPNCGEDCYCDIQKSKIGKPSCMEMDIIEANGNCKMATTIHTFPTDGQPNNPNCDRWGCGSIASLSGKKFHIKAEFAEDGTMTVSMDGVANNHYGPTPSASSNEEVVKTMTSIGAVIESSQWFGWAPAQDSCPTGSKDKLDSSHFAISKVRVMGKVVQGPEPTKCTGPAPTPPPSPPSPPSPPTPSAGCCSWDNTHCGQTTDYCKSSQDHCEKDCNGKWIHPSAGNQTVVV
jgi:hypothetical protein